MRRVLTLLGKPDCTLCRKMREVIEPVLSEYDATLVEKDVRDDPDTEKRYLWEIPVLFLGDQEVARHRVTEADLRERLERIGLRPLRR